MTSQTLKQEALAPFIRLLETKGILHTEQFVGMGFHDDRLYLLKLHARPEEVVARGDDFFFLNKKGDGPAFNVGNNQTLDQAAAAYHFYGKDEGTTFTDTLMVPPGEMERMLLINTLKRGLTALLTGEKPTEEQLLEGSITDMFNNPGVQQMLQTANPEQDLSEAEAHDMLSQAINSVNQPPAAPEGASEQPAATDTTEPQFHNAMEESVIIVEPATAATATPQATVRVEAEGERRGGIRGKLYAAMGFGPAI